MHPISQWLNFRYKDYGGFAKVTDDRFIGGFQQPPGGRINILNGSIDNQQFANLGGQKGALLSSYRSIETLAISDSFYFLPNVAAIAGAQGLPPPPTAGAHLVMVFGRIDRIQYLVAEGRSALEYRSDLAGVCQHLAERRGAEFRRKRQRTGRRVHSLYRHPTADRRLRSGTRMKRPDYAWEIAAYRANIRDELQCLFVPVIAGSCNVTNADRTIHQGIEAGAGAAIFSGIFNNGPAPDKLWLNLAYTFNDFRFDNDPNFGNNLLPGAPRHYLRAELLYRTRQDLVWTQCRMGAAVLLRRQREHAADLSLCSAGIEGGLRQWRSDFGLYRRTKSRQQGLHFQRQHHRSGDRDVAVVRTGQRARGLCRHEVSMVRRRYASPIFIHQRQRHRAAAGLLVFVPGFAVAESSNRSLPPVTVKRCAGCSSPIRTRPARDGGRAARQRRARAPAVAPPTPVAVNQPAIIQTTAGAVQEIRALSAVECDRTDTPIEQIPQSIQVVPRQLIDGSGRDLRQRSGVEHSGDVQPVHSLVVGNADQAPVKIRGFLLTNGATVSSTSTTSETATAS